MSLHSPGQAFRAALTKENPLQIVGAINANHALLAQRAGYQAIYLSGGGVAAGSLGLPDLGISTLDDVLTDIRRITDVCPLPLLVDADIGFGSSAFNVARTVKAITKRALAHCILRIRSALSAVDTVQIKRSSRKRRWWTGFGRRWMRAPIRTL
ncbi:2-methylisocitrate lyase [Salmonella enterica subsp. arizonae]|uniref:2-methylisocitrate lyase n=1 Tax=Salmonella enterica subsp. arizonae TaxID=59203 RepID=A0A379SGQ1_SALER|nr:2-methylisocitrate lyase [Salmonella enterica subsp. arizonae]